MFVLYYLLFVLVFYNSLCVPLEDQPYKENIKFELCSTANKKPGKCVPVKECAALFNLLKLRPISDTNVNYLKKSQCGFVGIEPKVCCALCDEDNPSLPVVTIPPTAQTAVTPGNVFPALDVCGLFVDDKLIFGKGTQLGSFPWLALLEYQTPKGIETHCGGVLITSRYVLTAAHCVSWKNIPENWNLVGVRLGEHDKTRDPDCIEVASYAECSTVVSVPIEEKIVHERYNPNDVNRYSNIAILRLAKHILYSEFISPICLPPTHDEGLGMLPFAIAGWGSSIQFEGYDVKRDATLSMKTNTECQNIYPLVKINGQADLICAAGTSDYRDTCNGDSGGVLMSVNPQYSLLGNYFAVGVMSIGPQNCSSNKPIVYTKVRNYLSWITLHMKP